MMRKPRIQIPDQTQVKAACGYVRCSTDEQGSTSIPQQRREIEGWASQRGYKIVDWFVDEGVSGTNFEKRPGFQQMRQDADTRRAKFQTVIVYDESRWGRAINLRENSFWKMYFTRLGVQVQLIHTNSQHGNTIGSCVVEMVESAEASEYSRKLSRSILRGMLAIEQGGYSRGGTAPYGYKRVAIDLGTGERRELRDGMRSSPKQEKVAWEMGDPLEVATVRRIFELKGKGVGYMSIADLLNTEHIPPPRRGRWKNKDTKWSKPTLFGIVHNRAYKGERVYNRSSFSPFVAETLNLPEDTGKRLNDPSKWIVIPSAHPVIIPAEIFEAANKDRVVEENQSWGGAHVNQHYYRSSYLLTSLIRCKKCGYAFQGFRHKKSGRSYYVDGGRKNKGGAVCGWYSIPQGDLEAFVLDGMKNTLMNPEMLKTIEKELKMLLDEEPSALRGKREMVALTLQDNEKRRRSLLDTIEKGSSSATVMERLAELEGQREDLEQELGRISREIDKASIEVNGMRLKSEDVVGLIREFFLNFRERFDQAPLMEKKELLRMVVEKIEVDPDQHSATTQYRKVPSGLFEREGISTFDGSKDRLHSVALTGIEPVFQP
jgi:DNA invertase Pin-like site-specific DNA recombinase